MLYYIILVLYFIKLQNIYINSIIEYMYNNIYI